MAAVAERKARAANAVAGMKRIYLRAGQREPEGRDILTGANGARYYLIPDAGRKAKEKVVQAVESDEVDRGADPIPLISDSEVVDFAINIAANLKRLGETDRDRVIGVAAKLIHL